MPIRQLMAAGSILLIFLLIVGCSREPITDKPTLKTVSSESEALLRANSLGFHDFRRSQWPPVIARLAPQAVYADRAGLHIKMSSWFVAEEGYFVPRIGFPTVETAATDPSYKSIGYGVFWYRIKG